MTSSLDLAECIYRVMTSQDCSKYGDKIHELCVTMLLDESSDSLDSLLDSVAKSVAIKFGFEYQTCETKIAHRDVFHKLTNPIILVGKSEKCHIRLNGPEVSDIHAMIFVFMKLSKIYIVDLNSGGFEAETKCLNGFEQSTPEARGIAVIELCQSAIFKFGGKQIIINPRECQICKSCFPKIELGCSECKICYSCFSDINKLPSCSNCESLNFQPVNKIRANIIIVDGSDNIIVDNAISQDFERVINLMGKSDQSAREIYITINLSCYRDRDIIYNIFRANNIHSTINILSSNFLLIINVGVKTLRLVSNLVIVLNRKVSFPVELGKRTLNPSSNNPTKRQRSDFM